MLRRIARTLICTASIAMAACSHTKAHAPDPRDPYENYNRVVFNFNQKIDNAVLKPVAYAYLAYLPSPFQFAISNFFDNLREIPNVANDIFQFKFAFAMHDMSRLLINSTVGILGIFDPATSLGLEHRKEDFGQTLYLWGYHKSSYLVIPFLGPSTVRDAYGMGVDYFALTIWPWVESDWKYAFLSVDYIDLRARLLRRQPVFDVLAVDEYNFLRDAYFQHRQYLFDKVDTKKSDDEQEEEVEDKAEEDFFKASNKSETKAVIKTDAKAEPKTDAKAPIDKPLS